MSIHAAGTPRSCHAFTPRATAVVSRLVPAALPPAARWNEDWNDAVAAAVERLLEAEDVDPEAFASRHRFIANGSVTLAEGVNTVSAETVVGAAPRELASAAAGLRVAFASRQASRIVEMLAKLSISAADLSDPFQVTAPVSEDRARARARFSDLISEDDLAGLIAAPWVVPADALDAGAVLAERSAAERAAVELAARSGDAAGLDRIRRDRLGAAMTLARTIAFEAWSEAGSPSLVDGAPRSGEARVWPTPGRGSATLSFSLTRGGVARVEIFDLAGRKRWRRVLDARPAGPQEIVLDSNVMAALPAGIYLARVSTDAGDQACGRIVRLSR